MGGRSRSSGMRAHRAASRSRPASRSRSCMTLRLCTLLLASPAAADWNRDNDGPVVTSAGKSKGNSGATVSQMEVAMKAALKAELAAQEAAETAKENAFRPLSPPGPSPPVPMQPPSIPEDFSWYGMSWRCCVEQKQVCPTPETPSWSCAKMPPDSCDDCTYFGKATDEAHASPTSCREQGGSYFCQVPEELKNHKPPPTAKSSRASATGAEAFAASAVGGPPSSPLHWSLGRHHYVKPDEVKSCAYFDSVEITVPGGVDKGFSDLIVKTKEECCAACALVPNRGCTDFVYQSDVSACVLLPHLPSSRLGRMSNLLVTSGTVTVTAIPPPPPHFECGYETEAGYSGGVISGADTSDSGARPTAEAEQLTADQCCQKCALYGGECAKFTYDAGSQQCTLHEGFAQLYHREGSKLVAGQVTDRIVRNTVNAAVPRPPPPPPHGVLDGFNYAATAPPPPSEHDEPDAVRDVMKNVSRVVISFMLVVLLLFSWLCFAPQILGLIYQLTNGRFGKLAAQPDLLAQTMAASKGGQRKQKKMLEDEDLLSLNGPGLPPVEDAKVTICANSLTQTRVLPVGDCRDFMALRSFLFGEFQAALKGVKPSQALIFCLADANAGRYADEEPDPGVDPTALSWYLVGPDSDYLRVRRCAAFMVQQKQEGDKLEASAMPAFAPRPLPELPMREEQLALEAKVAAPSVRAKIALREEGDEEASSAGAAVAAPTDAEEESEEEDVPIFRSDTQMDVSRPSERVADHPMAFRTSAFLMEDDAEAEARRIRKQAAEDFDV